MVNYFGCMEGLVEGMLHRERRMVKERANPGVISNAVERIWATLRRTHE